MIHCHVNVVGNKVEKSSFCSCLRYLGKLILIYECIMYIYVI
jgi:hypothetical protein